MILTSSRAIPHTTVDAFSDDDVILVADDIHWFLADQRWIEHFGDVLVAYWDPLLTDSDSGIAHSANIVQYQDTLKIEFSLWLVAMLDHTVHLPALPAELDAGYGVLVDKDRLTDSLRAPAYSGFISSPPDEAK